MFVLFFLCYVGETCTNRSYANKILESWIYVLRWIRQMTHNSDWNLWVFGRIRQKALNFVHCLQVIRWMEQMARDSAQSFGSHMAGHYTTCITGLVWQTDRRYVLQTSFIVDINNAGVSTNSINWQTDWLCVTKISSDKWINTARGSNNSINWWTDWHYVTRTSADRWINTASGSINSIDWQSIPTDRRSWTPAGTIWWQIPAHENRGKFQMHISIN